MDIYKEKGEWERPNYTYSEKNKKMKYICRDLGYIFIFWLSDLEYSWQYAIRILNNIMYYYCGINIKLGYYSYFKSGSTHIQWRSHSHTQHTAQLGNLNLNLIAPHLASPRVVATDPPMAHGWHEPHAHANNTQHATTNIPPHDHDAPPAQENSKHRSHDETSSHAACHLGGGGGPGGVLGGYVYAYNHHHPSMTHTQYQSIQHPTHDKSTRTHCALGGAHAHHHKYVVLT